jgi:hypothetical protein
MSSTFAPPTAPPPAGPPPAGSAWNPPELPQLDEAAHGRRRGGARLLVAALAAVAVIAVGIGAIVAIGSSRDGGVTLPAVEPFSLAAAAQNTVDARSVEFDLTVTAGDTGTVAVSGSIDNETKLVVVSTDMSGLLGLGDAIPIGDGSFELLYDAAGGVIYLDAAAFGGLLPGDSAWVSADLGALAEMSGTPLDDMQRELFVDPTDAARLLLDSDNAVEVGNETIDGVDTVHYQVTVDVAAAIAASPQAGAELGAADVALPDTVTYDVWVTSDNGLRRVSFDLAAAGQSVSMVLDIHASDQPLDVEVPTDAFDITAWLG